jgi:hypothetical protein
MKKKRKMREGTGVGWGKDFFLKGTEKRGRVKYFVEPCQGNPRV